MLPDWSVEFDMRRKPAAPLGFGPFGERPPVPANDQGSTLSRSVSDDLEAIFAESPPPTATVRPARVHSMAPQKKKAAETAAGPKSNRITAWGGIVAAAIAGVVVGTIVVKQPPKAPPPPTMAIASSTPTARKLTPSPPPPAEIATTTTRPQVKATPAKPLAKAKAPPSRNRPAAVRVPTRSAVLSADRELRQAYAAATKAGVPRGRLVSIRNRWTALRDDPPARLITGYAALTRELRQQSASAKGGHRKRGLFG